jgi:dihydrofolate reductase
MEIAIIAAVSENGVIGVEGGLPWHLPADLARFQRVTRGHPVVMGRRTFESLDGPLPERRNMVVTRNESYRAKQGVLVVHSLAEAISEAEVVAKTESETLYVLGGALLYTEALAVADRLDLTRVEAHVDGDTSFPDVDWRHWELRSTEHHAADDRHAHSFRFEEWVRKQD